MAKPDANEQPSSNVSQPLERVSGEVRTTAGSGAVPGFVERRKSQRYLVSADMTFASDLQELRGTICDLSIGGVCVAAYRLLPVRTPIAVTLSLPQGLVLCKAEIRWVKPGRGAPGRMGVSWLGLSDLDRNLLASVTSGAELSGAPASSRSPR